jgi:hypothetical protein
LCPLITTKIERIPPFEKGGPGGFRSYPPEKSPSIPLFQRGKYHYGVIEFKKDTYFLKQLFLVN